MRSPAIVLLTLAACAGRVAAAENPAASKAPDLATARVVDLTHAFGPDTIYWPTSPSAFELKTLADGKTPGGWFYRSNSLCTPEHGGTHLDAPSHFAKDGLTSEKIPVRQLIAPAAVIDVRAAAAKDPDYRLTVADVKAWEKAHGPVPAGTIVLLRTGWSERWPNRKAYLGDDTPGDASKLHFPSYGVEAARYLVTERKVGRARGRHGLDRLRRVAGFRGSRRRRKRERSGTRERRAPRRDLPEWGAWVIALPMKIAGGSGRPAPRRRAASVTSFFMTPAPPHPFGLHRSLDPPGVLPQVARRLDATPRALENEIAVAVRALSIDSASFRQLRETEASTREPVRDQIARIVRERGKMQNPVTGSGGMLLGEVAAVGPRHPAAATLAPGTPIASLVSLTLTPLHLESIGAVHIATERVEVSGTAILFARTLFAPLPADFPEEVALAAFDVAGAPAGVLAAAARADRARDRHGKGGPSLPRRRPRGRGPAGPRPGGRAVGAAAAGRARGLGLADEVFSVDARDPVAMLAAIEDATAARSPTSSSTSPTRRARRRRACSARSDDGTVIFFGMATSFSPRPPSGPKDWRGRRRLLIGNGFVPGHDRTALELLRRHPGLSRASPRSRLPQAPGRRRLTTAAAAALAEAILVGRPPNRLPRPRQKCRARRRRSSESSRSCTLRASRPGATSAGRDGEEFDAITGEPKPRFRVYPGQFIASAESTFGPRPLPSRRVATLPFSRGSGRPAAARGGRGRDGGHRAVHGLADGADRRGPRGAGARRRAARRRRRPAGLRLPAGSPMPWCSRSGCLPAILCSRSSSAAPGPPCSSA